MLLQRFGKALVKRLGVRRCCAVVEREIPALLDAAQLDTDAGLLQVAALNRLNKSAPTGALRRVNNVNKPHECFPVNSAGSKNSSLNAPLAVVPNHRFASLNRINEQG